jgi:hypothetical protein
VGIKKLLFTSRCSSLCAKSVRQYQRVEIGDVVLKEKKIRWIRGGRGGLEGNQAVKAVFKDRASSMRNDGKGGMGIKLKSGVRVDNETLKEDDTTSAIDRTRWI